MTSDDRSALQFRRMTETPIPQLVLSLAAPTILSMLITSIYNLADTFFVGTGNGRLRLYSQNDAPCCFVSAFTLAFASE